MVSSSSDYSSSSSEEDSRIPAAKTCAKTNRAKGSKPSAPLNNRTITYAELMKRKAEDDKVEDRRHRKGRIRRRILEDEEKRRFFDGVPYDSDADAFEEETVWVLPERKIKPHRRTRELQKFAKQVKDELEAEYKAEDDSGSDDLDIHLDSINGSGSDSDEEEDSEEDDYESDKSDDSDESDDSSMSFRNESQSKHEVEASVSVDVRVFVDAGKRRNGESVVVVDDNNNRVDEESTDSAEAVVRAHVHEYPTAGLPFEALMINTSPNNELNVPKVLDVRFPPIPSMVNCQSL
ncbi:transcription initiation factor TFIID subunit 11-like [Papaver somniferum]|uniref:transcription initiation factor TFIID subunit 11-like n=1 Tax=Papaver somniferum TaxID=3469 RepID=UPI000E705422|nr:transcription initiation factor TFIID subunit 11-like [Papaver somniferum]